ncbi:hypothetical protein EV14_2262 [Prochlorococcus sp. MIT 0703]|nr:hypothetical protein EV12_1566 [Prochlorococcus sp. MIT 0701]KGG31470.1 hypothetical protein EV14_2262 [Prochlorococcus sp. MIT 0703]
MKALLSHHLRGCNRFTTDQSQELQATPPGCEINWNQGL